ncbi:hypothetical protein PhCBS80983_g04659 [Powellomyces hirtus]|uniref:Calcium-activated potassium channel BK alpha subunit domain-containing protein n=1 Tax=Powellomyces hirtus TaxID=109895 RepID=A0A507DZM5_9FUNG|nr:hypothetical protein PhCBS80983_g04659 [Powellomyces hirtus]
MAQEIENYRENHHRPVGGLMNILLTNKRAEVRNSGNQSNSRSSSSNLLRQRHQDGTVSLEGLDASREEVAVTARKNKSFARYLVPHPFLRRTTGLSLVRTNYGIRKSATRKNDAPGYDENQRPQKLKPFRVLDAKYHVRQYIMNLAAVTETRAFAMIFVYLDLLVDLLLCLLYLYQISTAVPYPDVSTATWLFVTRPLWAYQVLVVLSFYNLLSFLSRVLLTNEKRRALLSYHPIVDLVTTVPVIVSLGLTNGRYLYVPYFLRCWYLIWRSNRAMSINMDVDSDMGAVSVNPLRHQLIILLSFITAILFTGMSAFQWAEMMFNAQNYTIIEVLYFSLVTASTVGYGDISPGHWVSQTVVIILLLVVLALVPGLISDFLDTWNLNKESSKTFIAGTKKHVILIGNFSNPNRVQDLLNGFLNLRNTRQPDIHIVIVGPKSAPLAVQSLLALPFYKTCTTYLQGSALNENDFDRMKSSEATAAFVLSNRSASDWFEEDQHTTLSSWSFHIHNPHVPLYAEVLLPETAAFHQMSEIVVCVDQIKQLLLGYNCLYTGASTMIMNLIFQSNPSDNCSLPWEYQYSDGLANEIYHRRVNEVFVGKSFAFVSWFVYVEFQAILFAVKPKARPGTDAGDGSLLLLNPGKEYKMKRGDTCFFIAQHASDMEHILRLTEIQMARAYRQYNVGPKDGSPDDVTVDVLDTHDQYSCDRKATKADLKPEPDFKIVNASDDEDGQRDSVPNRRLPRSGPVDRDAAQEVPQKPASIVNVAILDATLDPVDPIESLFEDLFVGRPEAPYTATLSDQPPICRLRKHPLKEMSECMTEDATHLRDHIIVCAGQQPLFRFMCTLRSATIPQSEIRDILIVGPAEPSDEEFAHTLAVFPRVTYLVGDCRRRCDMLRAGVEYAHTVLIMSKPENSFQASKDSNKKPAASEEDVTASFADSAAVMTSHVIYQILASCGISVNNVKSELEQINPDDEAQGVVGPVKQLQEIQEAQSGSSEKEGKSSRPSTLISSTSHRPKPPGSKHQVNVITELLDRKNIRFLHALECSTPMIDHLHSPIYASGQAVVSALLDNFIYAVYQNPATLEIVKALCGDLSDPPPKVATGNDTGAHTRSLLTTIPVGDTMHGKSFGDIYQALALNHGVVPVAILRAPAEILGNVLPFVYTNPVPATLLDKRDRLFVLSARPAVPVQTNAGAGPA